MEPTLVRGLFQVGCTYRGQRYRRSSGTGNLKAAERLQHQIDTRQDQLENGLIALPAGVQLRDFLLYGRTASTSDSDPAVTITMLALLDEFMPVLKKSPKIGDSFFKTLNVYANHLQGFLRSHCGLPAVPRDWTHLHLEQYREWRLKGKRTVGRKKRKGTGKQSAPRPYTVAKELAFIGRLFTHAIKQGYAEHNPFDRLDPIPDTKPEIPFRTVTEAERLLKTEKLTEQEKKLVLSNRILLTEDYPEFRALFWAKTDTVYIAQPGDVALFVEIATDTGMRGGEIARLDRLDINLDEGVITTRSRKQSRSRLEVQRHIPILGALRERLRAWLATHPERLLFGSKAETCDFRGKLYNRMDKVTAETRFYRIRPHMLRHSLRTNLTLAEVDERVIDEIIGHTTREMAERYRHITLAKTKAGMAALEQAVVPPPPEPSPSWDNMISIEDAFSYALMA